MSLVRINRPLYGPGKRPVRTKRVSAPKKEWVSTVNNLSVHKATPEELAKRHEMHRSQNKVVAQWDLREKALTRRQRKNQPPSPPGLDKTRLHVIREVFSDQCQFRDVIARSDRALAVVKDLFGDAPCRRTGRPCLCHSDVCAIIQINMLYVCVIGFPTITMAPDCDSDSELPVLQRPDPPTQLSLLSQSKMGQQALNELEEYEDEHDEDVQDTSVHLSSATVRHRKRNKGRSKSFPWGSEYQEQDLPETPHNTGVPEDQAALNATMAVQHLSRPTQPDTIQSTLQVSQVLNPGPASSQPATKRRSAQVSRGRTANTSGLNGSGLSSLAGNQSSLELLQSMLEQVEAELDSLEPQKPLSSDGRSPQQRQGLTGFSMALVATLGRLASHIKKKEEVAQREVQERRKLEKVVKEQRALTDALTAESLTMREESTALQARLQQETAEIEQRMDNVVLVLGGPDSADSKTAVHIPYNTAQKGSYHESGCIEKDLQKQNFVSSAVLLSPPCQRDGLPPAEESQKHLGWHEVSCASLLHYSGSYTATGSQGSLEEFDIPCSSSSFTSLPHPTPLLDDFSQDAMLGEIAELTRQNAAIRAQLGQHRPSPARASMSREQSADRLSITSSIVKQASPYTEPQHTQQPVCVARSSMTEIEKKLQELNRQSAEARAKLLELIEQQKQSTSRRVSHAISPVPPHSISTHTAVRGLTPEQFLTLPDRNHSPQPTASSRSKGNATER
ncbi:spindle and centriole-associated protein 1-like isoform X2 [Myxocyprinus asiaticus]|uniref:spindle and centriole-associated protein 1-like isoform X2 n=1 Tax=Myxocyprinus asiaticus TaxID=70543 RepID=UPI00222194FB|nr:spindle and centriole-associated protein 1-like isoform X2 [Myxocyprinus asiaticus]